MPPCSALRMAHPIAASTTAPMSGARCPAQGAQGRPGFLDSWDFDFGGPLLGESGQYRFADLGDLPTQSKQGAEPRSDRGLHPQYSGHGAIPIMIGGDDSTPIPFIKAFSEQAPLTILQIDAHIDWRQERYGEPLGFSSPCAGHPKWHMSPGHPGGPARHGLGARSRKSATPRRGERSSSPPPTFTCAGSHALEAYRGGISLLITLDCDGLDWPIMPAVAYPSTGGLTYTQVTRLIQGAIAKARLVGFDLIEFVPKRDKDGIGAFTAARISAM